MKIAELYNKYQIMPQLAEHQLRVAGITKLITDSWEDKLLANKCVIACLVHDMGNIVKFGNLSDPKWIEVKERFKKEYGTDAHTATCAILNEAGLSKFTNYVQEEADMYGKAKLTRLDFEKASKPCMMILYADLRVIPTGVVSLAERIDDLGKRYGEPRQERQWDKTLHEFIQRSTSIKIENIKESDVTPLFDELLTMAI